MNTLLAREIKRRGLVAIEEGLRQFLVTGFEPSNATFKGIVREFVEGPGNLDEGPYLAIGLPFRKGSGGGDFCSGFLTEHPPFVHQQIAWKRLLNSGDPASTLVATGTGSGKTECFLYPLLDHCLHEHLAGRNEGIKALVISPILFIVGDGHQRIIGRNKVVLSKCEIDIRGRSRKLRVNYRTTEEIRRSAVALLAGCSIDDLDGGADTQQGYTSLTHGEPPVHRHFPTSEEHAEAIDDRIGNALTQGARASSVCVLARTNKELESIERQRTRRDIPAQKIPH